jgi:excisionase family DNA binding protein
MTASKRKKNDPASGAVPLLMLTPDQAAEALQLSYFTVIRMCQSGELAAIKCGREWRIPMREVEALVDALMKKSAEVRATKAAPAA